MSIGISTACLYPEYTEQALAILLDQGFRLFEVFFNSPSELEPEFLSLLRRKLAHNGGKVKSVHPFTSGYESYLLFSNYERRFQDMIKFYDRYFQAAANLGAEILVLHGGRSPEMGGLPEPDFFERYAQLAERGKRYGVILAQENVNGFLSADQAFVRRMRNYLGDQVSFVLDVKQAVRSGSDPITMCKAMGDRLIHVHINDNNKEQDCLLPGRGDMDLKALKNILDGFGYQGDYIIEVYRKNFQELGELTKAYQYLRGVL